MFDMYIVMDLDARAQYVTQSIDTSHHKTKTVTAYGYAKTTRLGSRIV